MSEVNTFTTSWHTAHKNSCSMPILMVLLKLFHVSMRGLARTSSLGMNCQNGECQAARFVCLELFVGIRLPNVDSKSLSCNLIIFLVCAFCCNVPILQSQHLLQQSLSGTFHSVINDNDVAITKRIWFVAGWNATWKSTCHHKSVM